MALAVAMSSTGSKTRGSTNTIQVTGGAASTVYTMKVAQPNGGAWEDKITTDGSGNFSAPWPVNERGTYTVTVTPLGTGAVTTTFTGV